MAKWICPNKAKVPDHKEKILFEDKDSSLTAAKHAFIEVPTPAYCDICDQWYTRAECKKVAP